MSMHSSTPHPRREVVAEACEWFVEFRSGDELPGTRDRFDKWLRQSPENIQAYLEVATAWSDLPTQDPRGRLDIDALVARARSSRNGEVLLPFPSKSVSATRSDTPRRVPQTLAACVLVLAIFAGALTWLLTGVTYATGIGEQRTIRLSDSSLVDLNACSRIKIHFSRNVRTVELLQGQALFHVAKDAQRPFIVQSDGMTVRAVGTEFDVYRKPSGTVVTVLEGQVAVTGGARTRDENPNLLPATTVISAGEQLTVTPVVRTRKPHRADVTAATAWTQRLFVFEETPLTDVAEEFNRYSPRQLIIEDPELARRTISGTYSSSDPSSLIGFLGAQPELEIIETEQEIRVRGR